MVGQYPDPGGAVVGGVERVIDTLTIELAKVAEVSLFAPGSTVNARQNVGGRMIVHQRRAPGPGVARYWSIDAWRVAQAVNAFNPDIVHVQGMAAYGAWIRAPRIFTLHGVVDSNLLTNARGARWGRFAQLLAAKWIRHVELDAMLKLHNIILINRYVLEAMPNLSGCRIFAIPNPIDLAYCRPLDTALTAARVRRIVSVGRIGAGKDTLESIRIVSHLMKDDLLVEFWLAGKAYSENYLAECRKLVAANGLEERIRFVGNLSAAEISALLDRSACLLMTSRQETAPLCISEALARGVPVVAPRAFGIRYMIDEGKNGYFLETETDLATKAETLRLALDGDWDRGRLSKAAIEEYGPQAVARKTLQAYELVLRDKRSRAD